jgi:hypothetical protein
MDVVLEAGDPLVDETRAIALYFTRTIMFWKDPDGSVAADLTESADLFRRADDPGGEGLARISLALALMAGSPPDTDRAREVMEGSLRLFRGSGSIWGESMALVLLGRVALLQHKLEEAQDHFRSSLELSQRTGDVVGQRVASYHLGWARLFSGDVREARDDFGPRLRAGRDRRGRRRLRRGRTGGAARGSIARTPRAQRPAQRPHLHVPPVLPRPAAGGGVRRSTGCGHHRRP